MPAPIDWTPELEDSICAQLIEGESIRAICAKKEIPSTFSVFKRLGESEDFAKRYARARELQAEAMLEQIFEIADDSSRDTKIITHGESETEVADNEWINRSRLRVDTRKWAMSKLMPKKYGDKIDLNHSGEVSVKRVMVR
jgi:hypothetical protein